MPPRSAAACRHPALAISSKAASSAQGRGKTQGWGEPREVPKTASPNLPSFKEGLPLFPALPSTTWLQGDARGGMLGKDARGEMLGKDARGGMLGEARSHSSALLLRAAGDWRRVTSPLPRRGSRASPAIFGSGTSAYRREARALPPHRLTGRVPPREGERAEPKPPPHWKALRRRGAQPDGRPPLGQDWIAANEPGGLAGGSGEGNAGVQSCEASASSRH